MYSRKVNVRITRPVVRQNSSLINPIKKNNKTMTLKSSGEGVGGAEVGDREETVLDII